MQYVYCGGSMVEGWDGCLEGTPNWRIARFGWMCLWKDGTFVLRGRGIALCANSAGCVCEFVGRMIYIQAGQSLTSRACSTVGGAN